MNLHRGNEKTYVLRRIYKLSEKRSYGKQQLQYRAHDNIKGTQIHQKLELTSYSIISYILSLNQIKKKY